MNVSVPVPRALLAAAATLLVAYAARAVIAPGAPGTADQPMSWLYHGVELLVAAAVMLRARRATRERAAWTLVGLGVLAYVAGDLYWTFAISGLDEPPYPSFSDLGYLSFTPLVYAGGVLLVRARFGRLPANLWLDGAIAGLAVAAVGAELVFGEVIAVGHGDTAAVVTNLAYPLADLVLLSLVTGVLVVSGWRPGRTWAILGAGIAVFAVADSVYLLQSAAGTYVENTVLDVGWPLGLLLIGVAAWHPPSAAPLTRPSAWSIIAVPTVGAVVSLGLLTFDHFARVGDVPTVIAAVALAMVMVRLVLTFREHAAMLEAMRTQATTDVLTGLGNRRALLDDLDRVLAADRPSALLAIFDLDGFKGYNDTFGHLAGDALLERLGGRLGEATAGRGRAYRMGGDEFCVLFRAGAAPADVERGATALTEHGERFAIDCSYGTALIPDDTTEAVEALRIADGRMYEHKAGGRPSARRQATDALLTALDEREVELGHDIGEVAELSERTAVELGLDERACELTRLAAELHDIGKVAIPDAILSKPGPLDDGEWVFMKRHTIIGERILAAAPDLEPVGRIVRSSHERFDGDGYPDRLAGDAIPIEARIVAVADAYDAMTTDRPYRAGRTPDEALDELRRCAGGQFDPVVVMAFCAVVARVPA